MPQVNEFSWVKGCSVLIFLLVLNLFKFSVIFTHTSTLNFLKLFKFSFFSMF